MANDKKGLLLVGGIGLGLYLLAQHQNEQGQNPSSPPTGSSTPGLPTPTPLQQTQAQVAWLYNVLAQHGFKSSPLWYTATSMPTEIPQDATSANRNLVARDQSVTDLYQGFFWSVNKFFGWSYPAGSGNSTAFAPNGNFPGLTGANTATPDTDQAGWALMQTQFNQLTAKLTPTFLA